MRIFRQVLLLLISLFLLYGCVDTKNLSKEKSSAPFVTNAVLEKGYNTALYRAQIDIGDKHFSGLFFFKTYADSTYRIIFLSEFGINFLDLEYKNHTFELKNCIEFLNKKVIVNTLMSDFKLLIDVPRNIRKKYVYTNAAYQLSLIKLKEKSKKYYYFYTPDKKVSRIIQVKGFKHIEVLIHKYNNEIPQKIEINHKRINLNIKLKLIELK